MRKIGKGCCFWIFLCLFPLQVWAFVPDSSLLMDLMLEAMGGKGKVSMEIQRVLPSEEREPALVEEKFLFRIPDAFRSESRDGSSFWLANSGDHFLFVHDGKRLADSPPRLEDYFYAPLLIREKESLLHFLQRRGVDIGHTGLDRHEGKIGFCLGDPAGSHLFLDKESFHPLFLILEERGFGLKRRTEIRYRNWEGGKTPAFPREIDILDENGALLQQIRVRQLATGSFADNLMDLAALKKKYPLSGDDFRSPATSGSSDPLKDVEDSLDRFRKRYE